MVIEKVLNNNVVISKNELGEEIICMGKGLAFQKNQAIRSLKNRSKRICAKRFFLLRISSNN